MATPVILAENGGVTAGLKVLLNVGAGGGGAEEFMLPRILHRG
jgi:hypothetical protein